MNVNIAGSALEEKSYFKKLGLSFSSELDWSSCIVPMAKKCPQENWNLYLIHEVSFF